VNARTDQVAPPLGPLTPSERAAVGEDFFRRCYGAALIATVLLCSIAVVLALVDRDAAPTGTIVIVFAVLAGVAAVRGSSGYERVRRHRYTLVLAGPLTAISSLFPAVNANAVYFPALAPLALIACVAQRRRERVAVIVSLALGSTVAALLDTRSSELRAAGSIAGATIGVIVLGLLLSIVVDWSARRLLLEPDDGDVGRTVAPGARARTADIEAQQRKRERDERDQRVAAIREAPREHLVRLRPSSLAKLTARELQILFLIAERLDRYDIAECLAISPKTVDKHIENVRGKVGWTHSGRPTAQLTLELPQFTARGSDHKSA